MLMDGCSSKHTSTIFCQDKRNVPFEYKHGHNIKRTIETVLHVVISYFSFVMHEIITLSAPAARLSLARPRQAKAGC